MRALPLILAAASLALLSGCTAATAAPTADTQPAETESALSSEYEGQTLTIAVQSAWAPTGFLDENGESIGATIDLAREVEKRLGVTFELQTPAFADVIPGVQSGKYDFAFWPADITAERLKTVDQLAFLTQGYFLEAPVSASSKQYDSLEEACGISVAIVAGQTTQALLEAASQKCVTAGKGAIEVQTFPDQPSAELAVLSKRADAATVGNVTLAYKQSDAGKAQNQDSEDWEAIAPIFGKVKNGMVFKQGSELAPVIQAALEEIVEDGTYAEILSKWGIEESALDSIALNPTP